MNITTNNNNNNNNNKTKRKTNHDKILRKIFRRFIEHDQFGTTSFSNSSSSTLSSSSHKNRKHMSQKEFLIFCETLAGVMSPASNLMPEMCCMGKHLDRNDIDIVFRSTCGPKENHLNFLKFVKSLVALSLKLYPRVDASLAFSLFLAESVYGLDFIPYNVRCRANANANELLAVHTMNSIEAYSPIGKKIKKINLGLNARNEDIFD